MTLNARKEIYLKAFQKNGMYAQLDIAIEEMSELIKELCKYKRNEKNRDAILEELTDVLICAEQIKIAFSIKDNEIDDFMNFKLTRLEQRLNKIRIMEE